jgi:arylsulfatase A-like enzyme
MTSDHGYHIGEKDVIQKWHLWDESTRVPLFIHVPDAPSNGQSSSHPVSLLDIYPTLVDLCDLPKNPNNIPLDGHSLSPFLKDPSGESWSGPPVTLMAVEDNEDKQRHFSVCSQRYRYTLCSNGEEELYDHDNDPHEWTNLASKDEMAATKKRLKEEMMKIFRASKHPQGFNP